MKRKCKYKKHPDEDYIKSISGTSGSSWGCIMPNGRAKIGYIYGVNWFRIRLYNLILLLKYMKRKLNK